MAQQWLAWKLNLDAILDYKPHEEFRRDDDAAWISKE
jgi:hypothetical protein